MTLRERLGRTYDIVAGSRILLARGSAVGQAAGSSSASTPVGELERADPPKRSRVVL